MKDYSKIALFAALALLLIVVSQISLPAIFAGLGWWVKKIIPFAIIAWVIWMVCKGGCGSCCRTRTHESDEPEMEA